MKNFIKGTVFALIILIIFVFLNRLYNPCGSLGEWYAVTGVTEYYKQPKHTIDILYVGNSNVYTGISPLEMYEKNGVTGYAYSTPEQKVWTSYYAIKEALKTQKPKVIFLEAGEFFSNENDQSEQGKRKAIDPLKLSKNKLDMINDDVYKFTTFDKLSCLIPILRYHSRWNQLNEYDIKKFISNKEYSYFGYIPNKGVKSYNYKISDDEKRKIEDEIVDDGDLSKIPSTVKNYLSKIMDVCNENNIQLVIISMPAPKSWSEEKHNIVETFAIDNNLKFIDLNYDDDISIDWNTDSQDSGTHLNLYGAEKVANYLTNYINNNFKLEDHRNDENYKNWNEKIEKYEETKEKNKVGEDN